jgi:hypothetical protein
MAIGGWHFAFFPLSTLIIHPCLSAPPSPAGFVNPIQLRYFPKGLTGHFDVSGILETWKCHGHRFMDETKPPGHRDCLE